LKNNFVDKVFFSELHVPGESDGCCFKDYSIGYDIIGTLFPAALGYTDNGDGSKTPNLVSTGNLDLLHATIKTLQSATVSVKQTDGKTVDVAVGGDVTLFGPGGNINVGTTALEINPKLTNSALGVLTLDNGVIDIFTDQSVLVNQSRILTVQGGNMM